MLISLTLKNPFLLKKLPHSAPLYLLTQEALEIDILVKKIIKEKSELAYQ
jgi:hypothetical protein